MALVKSSAVVHNDITLTAGAGDTTSATQDMTGNYRTIARVRFTNGGTGPTVQAQCKIQVSEDTTSGNFMTLDTVYGGTVNSAVSEYVVEIPDPCEQLRFVSGSNTAQNVTLRVVVEKVTSI